MAGQGKAVVSRERERKPCPDNRLHRTPGIAAAAPRSTDTAPGWQVWHRSPIIPELNEPFYRLPALAIQERPGYKHRAARGGKNAPRRPLLMQGGCLVRRMLHALFR